ncbi:hypothetical protein [Geothrix terrae]|uniref:hypothetical protein n=1 Tax=Geothrix terrae TaxID=2922720 RepID=UPI001FACDC57|nr:hypothetical protein [Geothrix terrae]
MTTLSFRKESIQQSSSVSETLNRQKVAVTDGQGQRASHEPWAPTLTTTIFTVQ